MKLEIAQVHTYLAVVHHEPGSSYGISFPDLPDCFAAADDEKDLLKAAQQALRLYFKDGPEPPEGRDILELAKEILAADDRPYRVMPVVHVVPALTS